MGAEGEAIFDVDDVTVVVCTIERPDYLVACLDSLVRTTPEGVPLVVVFNGTSDATQRRARPALDGWPGPVRVVRFDEVQPLERSHGRALQMVETPLVNFMGDDDLVLSPRLNSIVDVFNTMRPTPAAVTSFARRIVGDPFEPRICSEKNLGPTTVDEWERWRLNGRMFEMLWPGAVLRVDALRAMGGFDAAFNRTADNRIFTVLAQEAPVVAINDNGFGYRIHGASVSSKCWSEQRFQVRHVAACLEARRAGLPEPSVAEFAAFERSRPRLRRLSQGQQDRSMASFRLGSELLLTGRPVAGAVRLLTSALHHPATFLKKLQDQTPRSVRKTTRAPLLPARERRSLAH